MLGYVPLHYCKDDEEEGGGGRGRETGGGGRGERGEEMWEEENRRTRAHDREEGIEGVRSEGR